MSCRPTIIPWYQFDDEEEERAAKTLKDAMKGFGTDEENITKCLLTYTTEQREKIANRYKTMYGSDLIDDLKGELGGNFEDVCVAMLTPKVLLDVRELHKAIKGAGTTEETLVEILVSRDNNELEEIKEKYMEEYGCSLEEDLTGDTGGYFENCVVSLVQGNREDSTGYVDDEKAQEDAQQLFDAGDGLGTEELEINAILCNRSFDHLRAVFDRFEELAGKPIEDVIKGETSGSLEDGFVSIVQCARNKPNYFARRLKKAMEGLGTDDDSLIRLIVSRSEIDLAEIKEEYQNMNEQSLEEAIESECSGDYKRILIGLVAGNEN